MNIQKKKTKHQTKNKNKQFKYKNTLFRGIFTGNMQTQLH